MLYNAVITEDRRSRYRRAEKMTKESMTTLENIHKSAKEEFLEKGFKGASLRNIVKTAGMTTGAFYGYYGSKEELFSALVGSQYDTIMGEYIKAQTDFRQLDPSEQNKHMGDISGQCMEWMVEYVYDNFDAVKLIICSSEGTRYCNMIHEMVEIEVEATNAFMETLRNLGKDVPIIDPCLEHILISGMFTGFFEMVVHDMPREKAREFVRELKDFHMAGWQKIMNM